MTFTVEDGTGVSGANSYVDVTYCDTFHSERGNTLWTGTTAVKQAALIKATDYITQVYASAFAGNRVKLSTAYLDFPRYGLYPILSNEVPVVLKQAVCILALEALSADLNPNLDRGGAIKSTKVDVVEVTYMDSASSRTTRPSIDGLLSSILSASVGGVNVKAYRA